MFTATDFDIVLATVRMQHWYGNESEQVKTESGTGCDPDPLRFPVVTAKHPLHASVVYHNWGKMSKWILPNEMGVSVRYQVPR